MAEAEAEAPAAADSPQDAEACYVATPHLRADDAARSFVEEHPDAVHVLTVEDEDVAYEWVLTFCEVAEQLSGRTPHLRGVDADVPGLERFPRVTE